MKCINCEFYKETNEKKKYGLCEIKLPPWINRKAITDGANIVDRVDGCDLGKEKEDEL